MRAAHSTDEMVSVTIHAAGPQPTTAEAHITNVHAPYGVYVQVRVGSALIYLYRRAAVEAHAAAWQSAAELATSLLPDRSIDRLPGTEPVGVVINVRGAASANVHYLPAHVAPNQRAHVRVRVGALAICAYDNQALTDYLAVWKEAKSQAARVFGDDQDQVIHTEPKPTTPITDALRGTTTT